MEWESLSKKKRRPNLSLSKTRSKKQNVDQSPKKPCCDEVAATTAVKQELSLAATDSVIINAKQQIQSISNIETAADNEKNSSSSCHMSIKYETLTASSSLPLNFESIKLEENEFLSQQLSTEEMIKGEPEPACVPRLPYHYYDLLKMDEKTEDEDKDKKKIKEEIKADKLKEEEEETLSYSVKLKQMVSEEYNVDIIPITSTASTSASTSESALVLEYHCPICNIQLASSTNLRQSHIDKCLDEQEEKEGERKNNNLEFNQCFVCSKDLSRFSAEQREVHLNRCLDLKQMQEKGMKDSTFAGQTIPSIDSLEQCPICHFDFVRIQQLKIKVSHLKQCSRKNNISAEVLKQKCRWIEWGHIEQQQQQHQQQQFNTSHKLNNVPSHFYMTDTHNDDDGHADDDFSERVIIHRAVSSKKIEKELDQQDEGLQTALAISFSLQAQKKKPSKKRQLIELDSADIWTPEESKAKSLERLKQLKLKKKPESVYAIRLNNTSRLLFNSSRISLWKMASLKQQQKKEEEQEGLCYQSLFLRKLYNT